jgi:hypothetical protein
LWGVGERRETCLKKRSKNKRGDGIVRYLYEKLGVKIWIRGEL